VEVGLHYFTYYKKLVWKKPVPKKFLDQKNKIVASFLTAGGGGSTKNRKKLSSFFSKTKNM
jgi:hypothetical protein